MRVSRLRPLRRPTESRPLLWLRWSPDGVVCGAVGQSVAPGCDADIVVFDPRRKLITAADQHSKTDCDLYEGTEVTGDAETVLVRGTVVADVGELKVEPAFGR